MTRWLLCLTLALAAGCAFDVESEPVAEESVDALDEVTPARVEPVLGAGSSLSPVAPAAPTAVPDTRKPTPDPWASDLSAGPTPDPWTPDECGAEPGSGSDSSSSDPASDTQAAALPSNTN